MWTKAKTKDNKESALRSNYELYKIFPKTDYKLHKGLAIETKNKLFNYSKLDRFEIYQIISKEKELLDYIPHTEKIEDLKQIIKLVKEYEKVILKPIEFSINTNVYLLEIVDSTFKIINRTKDKSEKLFLYSEEELKEFLLLNNISSNSYIIQRYIKLVRIGELFYDIRLNMQKEEESQWKCNTIQCKVGKDKFILYGKSKTGKNIYLKKAIRKSFPIGCLYDEVIEQVSLICTMACKVLQKNNSFLYEYEFDLGLDKDKKIWIIDVRISNSFKDFKQLDYTTYYLVRYPSILYSAN